MAFMLRKQHFYFAFDVYTFPPGASQPDRTAANTYCVHREKQLKHILSKWSVRKSISTADMAIMLATKRQRNGKATKFAYYGHAVNEDKFHRAAKRLRLPMPSSIGEYILLHWYISTDY